MIKGRNEPVYQYNWEDMSHLKVSILYDKVLPTAFRDNKRTHANIAWWNVGIKDSQMKRLPGIFGDHNYENLDMVNHMLHYYQVTYIFISKGNGFENTRTKVIEIIKKQNTGYFGLLEKCICSNRSNDEAAKKQVNALSIKLVYRIFFGTITCSNLINILQGVYNRKGKK